MSNPLEQPIMSLFTQMLAIPSPSGFEANMAHFISERLSDLGFSYEQDSAGNVLVRLPSKKENAPLYVFAAHMDELGLVITSIAEDGSLNVNRIGGLFPWKLGECPVEILTEKESIPAVVSMGTGHGANPDKALEWSDVRLITGLSVQELADAGVQVGCAAVPMQANRGPVVLGKGADPLIAAWTFDDRMGCGVLLELLKKIKQDALEADFSLIIAFTTQEEVGGNGAKFLCQREQVDVFVAVDGSPIPAGSNLALDGRPALWVKDRLAYYDADLNKAFAQAAEQAGTGVQLVVHEFAASDASLVKYAGGAGRIVCFGHVRANSHGFEVARLTVFDNMLNTLATFLQS